VCDQEQVTLAEPGWRILWSARIEDGYIKAPPVVVGDHLIVIERTIGPQSESRIRAYQLYSGEQVWMTDGMRVNELFLQSPDYVGENIAVYEPLGPVYVLRADSGKVVLELSDRLVFDLALDRERLYVQDYSGNFLAYGLTTGDLVWERRLEGGTKGGDLFATQGRLVVNLLKGLWVLEGSSGQTVAHFVPDDSSSGIARPTVYEDTVLVGEEGIGLNYLQAVSLETGELLWREKLKPFVMYESPTLAGGVIFFPGGDHLESGGVERVLAVELGSGDLVWSYEPGQGIGVLSGIAILHGTGYAIFSDGTLRSIDLETGTAKIILRSSALYHWDTDGAQDFSVPGVTTVGDSLFASFGCRTVYALQMPESDG
jgi:outer membrane protein assembly factor BamB